MGIKDQWKASAKGSGEKKGILGSRRGKLLAAGIGAAIVIALAASVLLNVKKGGTYVTLFPGISREENTEILAVLSGRGVIAKRNGEGEVMVPEDQLGDIMLDMSQLGYPKTALPFDIFSDNMGFTTTEFEKRQYLLMNLQDRLERTLKDMSGVKNAIVTLNVADDSNYVWETDRAPSTASVSLGLMPAFELSPDKVAAIKKLVASSVPRMIPENVAVVNADTMQEMMSGDIGSETSYGLGRLDFEARVEKRLEDKIENVLTLAYAPDKLRVSATVVIDYDKMITEDLQYEPQDNGKGVVEKYKEGQTVGGGAGGAGGIAGEELNTDIPGYGTNPSGGPDAAAGDYYRDVDYLVGYIKKQIEKDNVKLQKATVAIAVNDDNLTESKKQQIIDAASKAANIATEDIVVSSFRQMEQPKENAADKPALPADAASIAGIDYRILLAGAAAGLLLAAVLLVFILRKRKKKHRREDEALFSPFEGGEPDDVLSETQAAAGFDEADDGIFTRPDMSGNPVDQIRTFARSNAEIIASMISSWLKEDRK